MLHDRCSVRHERHTALCLYENCPVLYARCSVHYRYGTAARNTTPGGRRLGSRVCVDTGGGGAAHQTPGLLAACVLPPPASRLRVAASCLLNWDCFRVATPGSQHNPGNGGTCREQEMTRRRRKRRRIQHIHHPPQRDSRRSMPAMGGRPNPRRPATTSGRDAPSIAAGPGTGHRGDPRGRTRKGHRRARARTGGLRHVELEEGAIRLHLRDDKDILPRDLCACLGRLL